MISISTDYYNCTFCGKDDSKLRKKKNNIYKFMYFDKR